MVGLGLGIGLGFRSGQSQCVLLFRSVNCHIVVKSGTRRSRSVPPFRSVLEIIPTPQDGLSWHYNWGLSCSNWGEDPRAPLCTPLSTRGYVPRRTCVFPHAYTAAVRPRDFLTPSRPTWPYFRPVTARQTQPIAIIVHTSQFIDVHSVFKGSDVPNKIGRTWDMEATLYYYCPLTERTKPLLHVIANVVSES